MLTFLGLFFPLGNRMKISSLQVTKTFSHHKENHTQRRNHVLCFLISVMSLVLSSLYFWPSHLIRKTSQQAISALGLRFKGLPFKNTLYPKIGKQCRMQISVRVDHTQKSGINSLNANISSVNT